MFNRLDSTSSKEILEAIEQNDPKLVETIRHLMFVFEDLLLLSQEAVKEMLGKVDRKILTVALKGTSDQLKNHILQADVPARRGDAARRTWSAGADQDQGSGGGAAADHRGGPAAGSRRNHQPEGHGRRAVCRLNSSAAKPFATDPVAWRRVSSAEAITGSGTSDGAPGAGYISEAGTPGSRAGEVEQRVAAAHQQGLRGRASGRDGKALAAPLEAMQLKLARSIEELTGSRLRFRREAEQDVVALALAVARRILHRELTVSPEALLGLVKAALDKMEAREVHQVRVSRAGCRHGAAVLRPNGLAAARGSDRRCGAWRRAA